ncbi:MAG: hypothetical protein RSB99_03905 [Bacilli bacterium]
MATKGKEILGNRKGLIITLGICILGLVVIIGSSYAWYQANYISSKNHGVTAGSFAIVFNGGSGINLSAYPMTDAQGKSTTPYSFTVKNNGSVPAYYQVNLIKDSYSNLADGYIKYTLKKNGSDPAPSTLGNLRLLSNQYLGAGGTDTYELRLWLTDTAGNDTMNSKWMGNISVTAGEVSQ